MFAEIAVDTYQDPTKKLFTYEIPEELAGKIKPGDLVEVPFGKRIVEGFIYQLTSKKPAVRTKPITKIKKGQILTLNQIKLTHWMSSHYAAPPLDCLKCQLPGKGERYTEGKESEIEALLLIPYAARVKLRALELPSSERKTALVGSRSAIFTPLPNLKKIIIEEPENWIYKDERSPYYHAKDVAQKRAELEGLKLELKYLIPRVEDFPSVSPLADARGSLSSLRSEINLQGLRFPTLKVKIVDLKKEREASNFSPLSSEVAEAFRRLNLSGSKSSTRKVGLAYVVSREVKEKFNKALKTKGLDINRIEIAGAELFTQIGKAFDTAVLIDADTLLNLPDFRAHEKLLLTIAKLSKLSKGEVFIQTANPDYPLFEEIKTGNLKNFYHRELAARKPLLYPPFGVLAKLEFSAKTTAKVNFEAEKLHEALTANSKPQYQSKARYGARQQTAVKISPPYPPYSKSRGKAQLNIAVKAKTHRELEKVLALVPPTWRIVVDPESLL